MEYDAQKIAERALSLAEDRGLSDRAFGLAIGRGPDLVRNWKSGRAKSVSLETIQKVADYFGVSPGWIAFGDGEAGAVSRIPVISWVAASHFTGVHDVAALTDARRIDVAGLPPADYFGLEVRGSSMNMVAPEGSVIIVRSDEDAPQHNKYYVFGMEDEATFKRFRKDPDELVPQSTDPDHRAIPLTPNIRVIGQVVKVVREL
tara:strand:+ start:479 stop:1087 length:609 start_codon:yes stop_codon:yes gene_type:complete